LAERITELLNAGEVRDRVAALAKTLAPITDDDTVGVCLLLGGLWFAADLSRALAVEGRHLQVDALWLSSYDDGRTSGGRCERIGGPKTPVKGRSVIIIDDVVDSGLSLCEAVRIMQAEGARKIATVVFARKPWPKSRLIEPDYVAWEAPARFLVGYGMDDAGQMRGLPGIRAVDD